MVYKFDLLRQKYIKQLMPYLFKSNECHRLGESDEIYATKYYNNLYNLVESYILKADEDINRIQTREIEDDQTDEVVRKKGDLYDNWAEID